MRTENPENSLSWYSDRTEKIYIDLCQSSGWFGIRSWHASWVKHSAKDTPTFLRVYNFFSKYCLSCMCEICIWKILVSRCAGLAPAYQRPRAGSTRHVSDGLMQDWGRCLPTHTGGTQEWQTPSCVCCVLAQRSLLEQMKYPPGSNSHKKMWKLLW